MLALGLRQGHERFVGTVLVGLLCTLLVLSLPPAEAEAETRTEDQFGNWLRVCTTLPGQSKSCHLEQSVFLDAAKTQRLLHVVMTYNNGEEDPGMLLVLPLRISLPPGVFISIDERDPAQVPVERCENYGCRIELFVSPSSLEAFKKGQTAEVLFHDPDRNPVTIPFSLIGFTKGMAALK